MIAAQRLLGFVLLLLTVGCSGISTNYDYDLGADFTALHAYAWDEPAANAGPESLSIARVKVAVDTQLAKKDYLLVSEKPDFLVSAQTSTHREQQINAPVDWRYGGAYVYDYTEGNLDLNILDAKTRKVIWRGQAKSVVDGAKTPEERTELIDEAIEKLLRDFPPPK